MDEEARTEWAHKKSRLTLPADLAELPLSSVFHVGSGSKAASDEF